MDRNLYVEALMLDPVSAVMVQEARHAGQIDEAAAVLAWRIMWELAQLENEPKAPFLAANRAVF